jgi:hypothetical protein
MIRRYGSSVPVSAIHLPDNKPSLQVAAETLSLVTGTPFAEWQPKRGLPRIVPCACGKRVVVAGENGEIEFREGIRFQGSGRTSTVLCVSGFDG